jgi:hypothetical protein
VVAHTFNSSTREEKKVCVCVWGGGCMDVFQVKVEGGVSGPEREEGGKEE